MFRDVAVFCVLMMVFLFGFSFALVTLYHPIAKSSYKESPFPNFHSTFMFLLWGILKGGDWELETFVVGDTIEDNIGLLLIMVFAIISVIILLNLLIAMMSQSYAEVIEKADQEWKAAYTELVVTTRNELVLPPPLNVISIFMHVGEWLKTSAQQGKVSVEDLLTKSTKLLVIGGGADPAKYTEEAIECLKKVSADAVGHLYDLSTESEAGIGGGSMETDKLIQKVDDVKSNLKSCLTLAQTNEGETERLMQRIIHMEAVQNESLELLQKLKVLLPKTEGAPAAARARPGQSAAALNRQRQAQRNKQTSKAYGAASTTKAGKKAAKTAKAAKKN